LIILLLLYMYVEAGLIKLEHVSFTKNKKNLKVLQMSDIHVNNLMVSIKKIQKIIESNKPDFVILTGDYISNKKHIPDFLKLLNIVKADNIVYACLGNHEYKAFENNNEGLRTFISQMEALGVIVLQDNSSCFIKNSKKYNIIGFNDFNNRTNEVDTAINSIDPRAEVCIAISHNPEIVYKLPKGRIDYLFSGHFHGGQIWAPFNIEFKLMRNETLCKSGITRGLHKINEIELYINRGIGNICFPLRFLSRPEITIFNIP
jgi:uncharacterized protein